MLPCRSSIFALAFAGLVVFSNRLGFAGYFFSIPYLTLVLSHYRINRNITVKINNGLFEAR